MGKTRNLLDALSSRYPYLYHLTDRANVPGLQSRRQLLTAAHMLRLAKMPTGVRRKTSVEISTPAGIIKVRDQAPLHPGAVNLTGGWTFDKLVAEINEHCFFWPGDSRGPTPPAMKHYGRYKAESPVVIRMPLRAFLAVNDARGLRLSRYNSGAPRPAHGRLSPRGPKTYVTIEDFDGTVSRIVEIAYRGDARLPPDDLEAADYYGGPWQRA